MLDGQSEIYPPAPPSPVPDIMEPPPPLTTTDIALNSNNDGLTTFDQLFDELHPITIDSSRPRKIPSAKDSELESIKLQLEAAQRSLSEWQQHCALQEEEISDLVDRLAKASSDETLGSDMKDDAYFEEGLRRLDHEIQGYTCEFLREKHSYLPSRIPSWIRDVTDMDNTQWRLYLSAGLNKKLLRAMGQRYIAFVLLQRIFKPGLLRLFDSKLSAACSFILKGLDENPTNSARWRALTFKYLLQLLPPSPFSSKMDAIVDKTATKLWKDTRTFWVEGKKNMQIERLKRIVNHALALSIEFQKLPQEVIFVFRSEDCDTISRWVDRQPERDFYSNTQSRMLRDQSSHGKFEALTVFPGVYKTAGKADGELRGEAETVEYHPLQLSTFAYDFGKI
ncbi:hypothetical protein TWF696_005137 [Orbilia brochopaga]|uniref:Uncharacterized protein n=1 Tax=Orbilia brochopaga TaxID=3140254 RepID=A0AAV9V2K1_9PEZI